MAKSDIPDSLEPGHIAGQSPAPPERMAGHTAYDFSATAGDQGNEEDLGGRPAFLYRSGPWSGATLDQRGENLPRRDQPWKLERYFTLGVRDVLPFNATPEQVIRGIRTDGYFVWRENDPSRTAATSQ
ncbi:MAG: hypothetical protein JSS20_19350 [Proteobacteria bacterium]|nr:hypothetical protein [Pseudomonadota bacterium]